MPRPTHSSRFDYPDNIWWWVQVIKFRIMQSCTEHKNTSHKGIILMWKAKWLEHNTHNYLSFTLICPVGYCTCWNLSEKGHSYRKWKTEGQVVGNMHTELLRKGKGTKK
jgi:hypothetical protein